MVMVMLLMMVNVFLCGVNLGFAVETFKKHRYVLFGIHAAWAIVFGVWIIKMLFSM